MGPGAGCNLGQARRLGSARAWELARSCARSAHGRKTSIAAERRQHRAKAGSWRAGGPAAPGAWRQQGHEPGLPSEGPRGAPAPCRRRLPPPRGLLLWGCLGGLACSLLSLSHLLLPALALLAHRPSGRHLVAASAGCCNSRGLAGRPKGPERGVKRDSERDAERYILGRATKGHQASRANIDSSGGGEEKRADFREDKHNTEHGPVALRRILPCSSRNAPVPSCEHPPPRLPRPPRPRRSAHFVSPLCPRNIALAVSLASTGLSALPEALSLLLELAPLPPCIIHTSGRPLAPGPRHLSSDERRSGRAVPAKLYPRPKQQSGDLPAAAGSLGASAVAVGAGGRRPCPCLPGRAMQAITSGGDRNIFTHREGGGAAGPEAGQVGGPCLWISGLAVLGRS